MRVLFTLKSFITFRTGNLLIAKIVLVLLARRISILMNFSLTPHCDFDGTKNIVFSGKLESMTGIITVGREIKMFFAGVLSEYSSDDDILMTY